jgi:hypothetical protein
MEWARQLLKYGIRRVLGVEPTDTATMERRYAICRACPKYDAPHDKCTICGCYMSEKTRLRIHRNIPRVRYELTHCPEGRWGDLAVANDYRKLDGLEPLPEAAPPG